MEVVHGQFVETVICSGNRIGHHPFFFRCRRSLDSPPATPPGTPAAGGGGGGAGASVTFADGVDCGGGGGGGGGEECSLCQSAIDAASTGMNVVFKIYSTV